MGNIMDTKLLKYAEALGLSLLAIFAPIQSLLLTTGVMILADLITGIMAARKRKEPISSSGFRRTLVKIFVYESALMIAYLAEHYMSDALPFVKVASSMISLVEIKSIYENLNIISGSNLLKALLDSLNSQSNKK